MMQRHYIKLKAQFNRVYLSRCLAILWSGKLKPSFSRGYQFFLWMISRWRLRARDCIIAIWVLLLRFGGSCHSTMEVRQACHCISPVIWSIAWLLKTRLLVSSVHPQSWHRICAASVTMSFTGKGVWQLTVRIRRPINRKGEYVSIIIPQKYYAYNDCLANSLVLFS